LYELINKKHKKCKKDARTVVSRKNKTAVENNKILDDNKALHWKYFRASRCTSVPNFGAEEY
jgi:hypothetical protein